MKRVDPEHICELPIPTTKGARRVDGKLWTCPLCAQLWTYDYWNGRQWKMIAREAQ